MNTGNYTDTIVLRTCLKATTAISKGCAVATNGVGPATAVGDIKGVCADDIAIGSEVLLYPTGEIRKVVIGAAVSAGAKLTTEAGGTGRLVTAAIAGDVVVAIANEDGAAADDVIEAWIQSPYELGA